LDLRLTHGPDYTELVAIRKTEGGSEIESGFYDSVDAAVEFCVQASNRGLNVYYGINPRDRESIEGDPTLALRVNSHGPGKRGNADHIKRAVLQAIDIDAVRMSKGVLLKNVYANEYELDAVRKVKQELLLEFPHAGIVESGNGAHVLIQHPSTPLDDAYRDGAKLWVKETEVKIRQKLGKKDIEAEVSWDDISDPPRILRMPGTRNVKYETDPSAGRVQRLATLSRKWTQAPASFPDELRKKGRSVASPSRVRKESRRLSLELVHFAAGSLEEYPPRVNAHLSDHPDGLLATTLGGDRSEFIKGRDADGKPLRDRSRYDISIAANAFRAGCTDEEVLQTMLACPHGKARQEWLRGNKNYVLHKLEDASKRWEKEQATAGWDSPDSSAALVAERFAAERYPIQKSSRTLLRFEKEYFRFDGQSWAHLNEEVLDSQVNALLRKSSLIAKAGTPFQGHVMTNIRGMATISEIERNTWMDGSDRGLMINVANGLLDVDRLCSKAADPLEDHNPNYFTLNVLPFEFDPGATCPRWMEFIEHALPDEGTRRMLQQLFGLSLIPDTSYQRFWILYGQPKTGKSVACTVLTSLLGGDVSCQQRPDTMKL